MHTCICIYILQKYFSYKYIHVPYICRSVDQTIFCFLHGAMPFCMSPFNLVCSYFFGIHSIYIYGSFAALWNSSIHVLGNCICWLRVTGYGLRLLSTVWAYSLVCMYICTHMYLNTVCMCHFVHVCASVHVDMYMQTYHKCQSVCKTEAVFPFFSGTTSFNMYVFMYTFLY